MSEEADDPTLRQAAPARLLVDVVQPLCRFLHRSRPPAEGQRIARTVEPLLARVAERTGIVHRTLARDCGLAVVAGRPVDVTEHAVGDCEPRVVPEAGEDVDRLADLRQRRLAPQLLFARSELEEQTPEARVLRESPIADGLCAE